MFNMFSHISGVQNTALSESDMDIMKQPLMLL